MYHGRSVERTGAGQGSLQDRAQCLQIREGRVCAGERRLALFLELLVGAGEVGEPNTSKTQFPPHVAGDV